MLAFVCLVVCLVVSGASAQNICHSNHAQHTEDQVINRVVFEMDNNKDMVIELWELYYFFDHVLGYQQMSAFELSIIKGLDEEFLKSTASTFGADPVKKHDFTQNWHSLYHDSLAFVESFFDRFIDKNHNQLVDPDEIYQVLVDARRMHDASGDGKVQLDEMAVHLESLYKTPDCVVG